MWEYEYDEDNNETILYWDDEQQTIVSGEITEWKNGYPVTHETREAIAEAIQDAGTPDRIRMQFDFNYGFSERDSDQS